VLTGDFVVADGSGVAFIPGGEISAVLETAEQISRKEAGMTKAVMSGHPAAKVMGADYELLLDNGPK
jgi:4-hydroxy-4-methyl-2-oxoglutarate aldolase